MKSQSYKSLLYGALMALLVFGLAYLAVLFTGVGDTMIYRNTGYDVTGKAREKYHREVDEENAAMKAKLDAMPKTEVQVDSAKYNFGKIAGDKKVNHTYKIKNIGTEDLIISDVRVSCGCTVADYTKSPVPTGEFADVTISFDPEGKSGHVEKSLHFYANTPNIPMPLGFAADIEK